MFRKLYGHWYVRIPIKLVIALAGAKFFRDTIDYFAIGFQLGMPRVLNIYHGQNPISPPLAPAYPYADTYDHLQNLKAYQQYQANFYKSIYHNLHKARHLLNDHPCRENPDAIDEFVQYGNIYRVKEYMNYVFVNKLRQQGIEIPEGINQKIRELEQYRLDFLRPIVPQL